MKAWIVSDFSYEWVGLFHADTAGQAKLRALEEYGIDCDYIDMRARRFPKLDDRPFTYEDCKDAGFEYTDEGEPVNSETFRNDCPCDICKGVKT
jgi:hypothetical protein